MNGTKHENHESTFPCSQGIVLQTRKFDRDKIVHLHYLYISFDANAAVFQMHQMDTIILNALSEVPYSNKTRDIASRSSLICSVLKQLSSFLYSAVPNNSITLKYTLTYHILSI